MDEVVLLGKVLSQDEAMRLALALAAKGAGFVSPNPCVGCVVLDSEDRLIGQGFHEKYGGPHAEVNALRGISAEKLKAARLFVTLEPCAHEGKTPSCAKMLAQLPLAEVCYGLIDPNPLVAGQGLKIIEAAGIKASPWNKLQTELEEVAEHFLMNQRHKKPFVSLKVASSLDGQLGMASGDSQWITGTVARHHGHVLRASHDATLVGAGTILMDDPKLNIRHENFAGKRNKLIVLDPSGQILERPELQIFKEHLPEDLFVVVADQSLSSKKAQVIQGLTLSGKSPVEYDLKQILNFFFQAQIHSILVEGGAKTLSSFIMQKEAHRLYLFQAPLLLGAGSGKAWSEQVTIANMDQRIALTGLSGKNLGPDLLLSGGCFNGSLRIMDSGLGPQEKTTSLEDSQSFLDSLKNEWSLFWHSLVGDDLNKVEDKDLMTAKQLQKLTPEQVKQITRALSQDRRRLNQRIEHINHAIETHSELMLNLELVSGDPEETLKKISDLNDLGQQLSSELQKIDAQLRRFRERSSL